MPSELEIREPSLEERKRLAAAASRAWEEHVERELTFEEYAEELRATAKAVGDAAKYLGEMRDHGASDEVLEHARETFSKVVAQASRTVTADEFEKLVRQAERAEIREGWVDDHLFRAVVEAVSRETCRPVARTTLARPNVSRRRTSSSRGSPGRQSGDDPPEHDLASAEAVS